MDYSDRLRAHLAQTEQDFPGGWKHVASQRPEPQRWHPACWVSDFLLDPELVVTGDRAAILTAMATWRLGKGIYRFEPDLLDSLVNCDMKNNLPPELLVRLPEWCVYVPTPDGQFGKTMAGFFAYITAHPETPMVPVLRIVWDNDNRRVFDSIDNGVVKMHVGPRFDFDTVYLDRNDLRAATHDPYLDLLKEWKPNLDNVRSWEQYERADPTSASRLMESQVRSGVARTSKALLLLMYLCSEEPDVSDRTRPDVAPERASLAKKKWIGAGLIRQWDVGDRIMKPSASSTGPTGSTGTGSRARPHIRAAHWHVYWTGKGRTIPKAKWLQPIPVNHEPDLAIPIVEREIGVSV